MWHTGTGKIIYDPKREGLKKRNEWWCVINVDPEITRYYRWWVQKELWHHLYEPAFGAHISIIRGEKPRPHLMHLWRAYHGKTVEFRYKHELKIAKDQFWFLEVECPFAKQIRDEFGIPSNWLQHITVGKNDPN